MAVIVLIKRTARVDRINEFLEKYKAEKPDHPGFISEYLTKLNKDVDGPVRSLDLSGSNGNNEGVEFVNVAFWKSIEEFTQYFKPKDEYFDPETESSPRVRATLDIIEASGHLPPGVVWK